MNPSYPLITLNSSAPLEYLPSSICPILSTTPILSFILLLALELIIFLLLYSLLLLASLYDDLYPYYLALYLLLAAGADSAVALSLFFNLFPIPSTPYHSLSLCLYACPITSIPIPSPIPSPLLYLSIPSL